MTKQNIARINQWKVENVSRINLEFRKDSGILERIQVAVDAGKAKSRQSYIIAAVCAALDRDGIPEVKRNPDGD